MMFARERRFHQLDVRDRIIFKRISRKFLSFTVCELNILKLGAGFFRSEIFHLHVDFKRRFF